MSAARIAVVGAGIAGLAHAWAAAKRGHRVTVFERDTQALGASVRNFGLGLLLGQPLGELFELASHSRALWLELLPALGAWHKAEGSLTVARDAAELAVLQAFQAELGVSYGTRLMDATALAAACPLQGLGALHSPHEIAFESRVVVPLLARWLAERWGVRFEWGCQVNAVELPVLHTSRGRFEAEQLFVCSGHDFQTLYPQAYAPLALRCCALQMLRVANPGITLGPALMTGLSTLHYGSFKQHEALAAPLAALQAQVQAQEPQLLEEGIHLIVQQVGSSGELVIGDSHRYGESVSPFGSASVDEALLALAQQLLGKPLQVLERWQGVYASGPRAYERLQPAPGVQALAITAGVGMSISLALAERAFEA